MRSAALVLLLAACGGSADAPVPVDAAVDAAIAVVEVSCLDVEPAVTVGTAGGEYAPDPATIGVGEVIRWQMAAGHTVRSRPSGQFEVPQGETKCFRFSVAAEYEYYCQVHGFLGLLIVE